MNLVDDLHRALEGYSVAIEELAQPAPDDDTFGELWIDTTDPDVALI